MDHKFKKKTGFLVYSAKGFGHIATELFKANRIMFTTYEKLTGARKSYLGS